MIRAIFFWLHLSLGVVCGVFIFVMAATGVLLSFERQAIELADRDIRSVLVPSEARPLAVNELLAAVRRSGLGEPSAVVLRNEAQAATQLSIGRNKSVYVDPYSGAILGPSSPRAHDFFAAVERFHRALGSPLGSKSAGHWLAAASNLLFAILILLGVFLWLPRKWNWKAVRASSFFRAGIVGKAREWNWHNVVGLWCALPLLVIALTGVVMSFDWANTLLFRLSGSAPPASGREERRPHISPSGAMPEPDYDRLLVAAKALNPAWRTITLSIVRDAHAPIPATIDCGTGGQPQKRSQYMLNRDTGAVLKATSFASGSLGQKLRAFVRFGHTGEYLGWAGQLIAAIASLGACLLTWTGLSLSIRRLSAYRRRRCPTPYPASISTQPT